MDSCLKSNEMQGGCTASFVIYQSRKQCNTQKSRIPGGKEEQRALAGPHAPCGCCLWENAQAPSMPPTPSKEVVRGLILGRQIFIQLTAIL